MWVWWRKQLTMDEDTAVETVYRLADAGGERAADRLGAMTDVAVRETRTTLGLLVPDAPADAAVLGIELGGTTVERVLVVVEHGSKPHELHTAERVHDLLADLGDDQRLRLLVHAYADVDLRARSHPPARRPATPWG